MRAAIDTERQSQSGLELDRFFVGGCSRSAGAAEDHFRLQWRYAMFFCEIFDGILLLWIGLISHNAPNANEIIAEEYKITQAQQRWYLPIMRGKNF
ncbi:hypothetical protein [Phyllobacterium phragmitis]|uniref:hypothetical protein n=1 Tax=Phyllobacterium phragmitis TaxID=2670329 RepID=UPI0011B26C86|nr:hypothetical protein [Phyllobacterium phragmitis]